jgi:hypothetical protein
VLALALLVAPAGFLAHSPLPAAGGAPSSTPSCSGAALPQRYSGALEVDGGSLPASAVANLSLSYRFNTETTWTNLSTGAVVAQQCESVEGTVATNSNGSFSLVLVLANSSCNRFEGVCVTSTGPFGPLSVDPVTAVPVGYVESVVRNGSSLTVAFVADLTSIALDPAGPLAVFSPDAPAILVARGLSGNGSSSPYSPQFTWSLNGSGWNLAVLPAGDSVRVTATPGAPPASLTVSAALPTDEGGQTAGPAGLTLEAVATSISSAGENRTLVDAGRTVRFALSALGAPGYTYNATVLPGLGVTTQVLACVPATPVGSSLSLGCTGTVSYPAPGTATPEVVVSNGYSAATENLTPLTVLPPPSLGIFPEPLAGYAGASMSSTVEAVSGTGSVPYQQACWDPGDGSTVCSSTPGPTWTFHTTYASIGTYTASAWDVDGDGVTGRVSAPVTIVDPLDLGTILVSSSSVPVGTLVDLSAPLTGGLLPAADWWNVSGLNGSLESGPVRVDGLLSDSWIPPTVGPFYVSLAVVDALGTYVHRTLLLTVDPDVATSLPAVVLPPAAAVPAGVPTALAWQAYTAHGFAAVSFAPTAYLRVTDPAGTLAPEAWANASGVGQLPSLGDGLYSVPARAWASGRLNLTVSSVLAGSLQVELTGAGIPTSSPVVTVDVAPDLGHLQLYDPHVVVAGERTNRTYWLVRDEYGNAAVGASLEVDFESGGTAQARTAPVEGGPAGTVGVWVNYTMPTSAGGSFEVRSSGGQVLLGPVAIPAAPLTMGGPPVGTLIAAGGGIGALGLACGVAIRRRSLRRRTTEAFVPEATLGELVLGRDRVIATVRDAGAIDLAGIERAWSAEFPPDDLADWVASLVADGTLGARTGPDGVARFCLAGPASGPAHVILDADALDRATRTREDLVREPPSRENDP